MDIQIERHSLGVYGGVRYSAIDADSYDGAPDSESPMGWGSTPDEAEADLLEQWPDYDENDGQPDEAQEWHDYDPDC